MIGLRSERHVDIWRARHNFLAFCLRDTASDCDHHAPAGLFLFQLEGLKTAKLRIDLLCCLLANVARIENNEIGTFRALNAAIAKRSHDVRHAHGIVLVHLTTVGLYEKCLSQEHRPADQHAAGLSVIQRRGLRVQI